MDNQTPSAPIAPANSDQELQNRLAQGLKVRPDKPEAKKLDPIQEALNLKKEVIASNIIGSITPESGAGTGTAVTVHKADEVMAIQVLKGYSDVLTTLLTQVLKSREALPVGSQDTEKAILFNYLIEEIKSTRAKMSSGNVNPLDMIDEYQKKMTSWQKSMQEQFGSGFMGNANDPGNIEIMRLNLELEDRRTERTQMQIQHTAAENAAERRFQTAEGEAKRRYEAERDDLHRRWEVEDKRWNAEFQLKKDQLKEESGKKAETVGTLQDVAGAFIASLKPGGGPRQGAAPGPGAGTAAQGAQPNGVNFPVSFTCTEINPETNEPCGTNFPWPADQMQANCPKCGAEYTLKVAQ